MQERPHELGTVADEERKTRTRDFRAAREIKQLFEARDFPVRPRVRPDPGPCRA